MQSKSVNKTHTVNPLLNTERSLQKPVNIKCVTDVVNMLILQPSNVNK